MMNAILTPTANEQMATRTISSRIDSCSVALIIAPSEFRLVQTALHQQPQPAITKIYVLDERAGSGADAGLEGEPDPHVFSRLAEFVAACDADMLVISERRDLLRREVAFAVIELSLKGIPVCTLAEFLAAPELRRGLAPSPRVVDHLLSALAAAQPDSRAKRLVDVLVGSLALLATLPLFALIAVATRLDSPGPVFFVQERLGRLRAPFSCLKFRTMRHDAEHATGPVWALPDDPRITRVGRFLRRSRLDELPQLINVDRGEMSIVGARPIRRHFADQLAARVPFYDIRFLQKPGLTGWAQIKHSYSSTFAEQIEKFNHDYYYIRNYSIWLDLHIMILTVGEMIRMKGT
jgi:lipopolysaccharide/colanic/teichoic acid biosynthesis glycosyltransferase